MNAIVQSTTRAIVFLRCNHVLFAESEHKERDIPQAVAATAKWLGPKTLRLHDRPIFLREVENDLDQSLIRFRALGHAWILRCSPPQQPCSQWHVSHLNDWRNIPISLIEPGRNVGNCRAYWCAVLFSGRIDE